MKKILLIAFCWPIFQMYSPVYAQKEKTKESSREIIIIKNGDKEKKLTIETKDGEVFINGKPASDYKDSDIEVIRQKFNNDFNFSFAPGAKAFTMFNGLNGEKKAFLGVTTEKTTDGIKITAISKGAAAEKAGLKEGDIITKVGAKTITEPEDLMDAITAYKPKDDVTIYYKRDGKAADAKATLGDRNFSRTFSYNSNGNGNFNFAIPKIAEIPNQPFAMTWGFNRGRLGVKIEDTDNDSGAKITNVNEESAAAKAGLKENDIITEVNGNKVKDVNEVRKELSAVNDKSNYNVKAKRNGSDMNFEIKIPKKINKADL